MRGFATFRGKRGGNGRNLGGPGGSRSAALTTGTARSRNRRNRSQKGWMWPLGIRAAGLWWAQRALPRGTMLDSSGAGSFGVLTRPVGKPEGRMGAAPCQGEAISRSCSSQPWHSGGVMESLGRGRATSLYPRLLQARPGTFQGWRKRWEQHQDKNPFPWELSRSLPVIPGTLPALRKARVPLHPFPSLPSQQLLMDGGIQAAIPGSLPLIIEPHLPWRRCRKTGLAWNSTWPGKFQRLLPQRCRSRGLGTRDSFRSRVGNSLGTFLSSSNSVKFL